MFILYRQKDLICILSPTHSKYMTLTLPLIEAVKSSRQKSFQRVGHPILISGGVPQIACASSLGLRTDRTVSKHASVQGKGSGNADLQGH